MVLFLGEKLISGSREDPFVVVGVVSLESSEAVAKALFVLEVVALLLLDVRIFLLLLMPFGCDVFAAFPLPAF